MRYSALEMAAKWFGMAIKSILLACWYLLSWIGNAMRVFKKTDGESNG